MPDIVLKMKNGETRLFREGQRPGGSYQQTIDFKGGFAIITDVWGKQTAIPSADIAEVTVDRGLTGGGFNGVDTDE